MVDVEELEKEMTGLIGDGNYKEAERCLLSAYAELKACDNKIDLDFVLGQLAFFYSLPRAKDLAKAEAYFLEREKLSPGTHAKLQTAWFYFYSASNFAKTIEKVDEIGVLKAASSSGDYYSALAVKGHALLILGKVTEADQVLQELLMLIKSYPPKFPFGDEMNFLEAAAHQVLLTSIVREILNLILPNIKSPEHAKRGEALLESM
ncbi:MAG TPA: hypothetical protein VI685_20920 [Candidatus Angelobacter sp.]